MINESIIKEISDKYSTPMFVFDLDAFTNRLRWIRSILGADIGLVYAMKANPFLISAAAPDVDGFEVCSMGEYEICRRKELTGEKIVLSGVNKEPSDVCRVIAEDGAGYYTAESVGQLILLEKYAAEMNKSVSVLLRVTSGNQFGMDEDTIRSLISDRDRYSHLDIKGLQYYSGTQKKNPEKIQEELLYLDELCMQLEEDGFEIQELEYGPGFYVSYFAGETPPDEQMMLQDFAGFVSKMRWRGKLTLEMGRFLAADCGSYLTRIADQKCNQGQNYCIVDGGINHLNYYGQTMAMKIPRHRFLPGTYFLPGNDERATGEGEGGTSDSDLLTRPGKEQRYNICGSLCTTADVIVKNLPLYDAQIGNLLVFDYVGAYSVTEGIYLFLSRKMPMVLFYDQQHGTRIARESLRTDGMI